MTTLVSASNYDDNWVRNVLARNPCWEAPAGAPNAGNIRTAPGRISFPSLLKATKGMDDSKEPTYRTSLLFPLGADLTVLKAAATRVALEKWPSLGQPGGLTPAMIETPFKEQAKKANIEGYVPGAIYITAATKRRPQVVNLQGSPIVSEDDIRPGYWAFVTLRPFAYEVKAPNGNAVMKRGLSFGLQSVMIICPDKELGGTSGDPTQDFAGVNVDGLGAAFDPQAAFGAQQAAIVAGHGQPGMAGQPYDPLAAAMAAAASPPAPAAGGSMF